MNTRQGDAFETLRGAENFLMQHSRALPGVIGTGAHRHLEAILQDLSAHVAAQQDSAMQARMATRTLESRRTSLRMKQAVIVSIARLHLESTPEVAVFRMPKTSLPVEKLAAGAHAMASAARKHADLFISAGLEPDFADELDQAAEALIAAQQQRLLARTGARGATDGIRKTISAGRRIIAVLDTFVRTAAPGDTALISGWSTAAQVPRLASMDDAHRVRYDPSRTLGGGTADAPRLAERSVDGAEYRADPIIAQSRVIPDDEAVGREDGQASSRPQESPASRAD